MLMLLLCGVDEQMTLRRSLLRRLPRLAIMMNSLPACLLMNPVMQSMTSTMRSLVKVNDSRSLSIHGKVFFGGGGGFLT